MTEPDLATTFLDHVDADRPAAATQLGLDVLADHGPDALVGELLVPTMRQTGCRWQDGSYSVTDEHHVTTLVEDLVSTASKRAAGPEDPGPAVLITSAEGERHVLPSRMLALQLRTRGEDVRHSGGDLPAAELEAALRSGGIDALLVSCTLPAALGGAADMVDVAHRTGVPVLIGGRALRRHPEAGALLGADGAAADVDDVMATLAAWRTRGVPARSPASGLDPTGERAQLGPTRPGLVQAVLEALRPARRSDVEGEVDALLRMLEVSLLLDTPDVLHEHIAWLGARGDTMPVARLPVGEVLETVRVKLPSRLRRSRSYLTEAAARASA